MKWTQRQKIGGVVLVLAAGAFALDRWSASSSTDPSLAGSLANVPTSRGMKSAEATVQSAATTTAIAQRLERVSAVELISPGVSSDAFSPPAGWFGARGSASRVGGDAASEFRAKYRLSAVMKSGPSGGGVAMLVGPAGGVAVRAGQSIDGFVLQAVRETAVVLDDGHGQVELRLDRASLGATATIAQ